MSEMPVAKPYLVAFKATSMETRAKIIGWLRIYEAVHVLADVWVLSVAQTDAGTIHHEIKQYDEFGAQLIVVELGPDWAAEGFSNEAQHWVRTHLTP